MALYDNCCAMSGTLQEASEQMNTHIMDQPRLKWDATRYLAASVRDMALLPARATRVGIVVAR
eukprot:scaffold29447_cov90-Isochrysis_galbana.AAC.1